MFKGNTGPALRVSVTNIVSRSIYMYFSAQYPGVLRAQQWDDLKHLSFNSVSLKYNTTCLLCFNGLPLFLYDNYVTLFDILLHADIEQSCIFWWKYILHREQGTSRRILWSSLFLTVWSGGAGEKHYSLFY